MTGVRTSGRLGNDLSVCRVLCIEKLLQVRSSVLWLDHTIVFRITWNSRQYQPLIWFDWRQTRLTVIWVLHRNTVWLMWRVLLQADLL